VGQAITEIPSQYIGDPLARMGILPADPFAGPAEWSSRTHGRRHCHKPMLLQAPITMRRRGAWRRSPDTTPGPRSDRARHRRRIANDRDRTPVRSWPRVGNRSA
jgi:hypothetical protein